MKTQEKSEKIQIPKNLLCIKTQEICQNSSFRKIHEPKVHYSAGLDSEKKACQKNIAA